MANTLTNDLPLGDLQLFDNYVPALTAGNWSIGVTHTVTQSNLTPVNTDPLSAQQTFVVSAPQFAIDPSEIVAQYPPNSSTGLYGQVLPHIVLKEPLLPWERKINDPSNTEPWLALLVLGADELVGAVESTVRATTTTVTDYLTAQAGVYKPPIVKEDDVDGSDACSYIQITPATFQAVMPLLAELRYLAHCRQANIQDKAIQGLGADGLFSVVVANRFPAVPAAAGDPPLQSIVHLVSVEGFEAAIADPTILASAATVAMLTLASWTFQSLPSVSEDFRGLMEAIVSTETADGVTYHPQNLALNLPPPQVDLADPVQKDLANRIADGYVPLGFHTRSGEETFGWYRGPFTPVLPAPLAKSAPFFTADAAMIYQNSYGVFDLSLASAWQIGRAAALADKSFGQTLFDFRRKGHLLTDKLLYRLQSDHFTQTQIDTLDGDTTIQNQLLSVLNTQLLADIGAPVAITPSVPQAPPPDPDPKTALQNFLTDPTVQAQILDAVGTDLDPVAQWLAKLLLLYPVPFAQLVPDARMLPVESLRFFYVDTNWMGALLDGAQSIGLDSSRQTFYSELTQGLLEDSAYEAMQVYRNNLLGVEPTGPQAGRAIVTGMLLRSAVVSGWPNLAVRPTLGGQPVKMLRMDHLSPSVLLCLFWGAPDTIEISEPQEGFRFGVDDDGLIPLREPIPPAQAGGTPLGTQIVGQTFAVTGTNGHLRPAPSRVLDLNPASPTSLIQTLQAALSKQIGSTLAAFGPADFALQMVKSPEAIQFKTQP